MLRRAGTDMQRDQYSERRAAAVTNIRTDDQPGFVAQKSEHRFACYCLFRPGQTYCLTIEDEVLRADDALTEQA